MKAAHRIAALRAERQDVLDLCATLVDAEWEAPSKADGWRVADVVAHLGATARILITPAAVPAMFGNDAEATNDVLVGKRESWSHHEVLDDYRRWSGRVAAVMTVVARPPLASTPLRLAELGWYPMRLVPSLLVFDTHVHLCHDVLPALGRSGDPASGERMAVVLEWMMAGLEQMNRDRMGWLEAPMAITLTGPGGGTWRIDPGRGGRLRVRTDTARGTAAQIAGEAAAFPSWSTTRTSWRDADLVLTGDRDLAMRFLDSLDIV